MSIGILRRTVSIGFLCGAAIFAESFCGGGRLFAGELELIHAAMNSIKTDGLRQHTLFLASDTLEGREAGSKGGHAAAAYLAGILKKAKLEAKGENGYYTQDFGDDYRNLLAYLPGSDPQLADEIIMVGAHYDHVGFGTSQNSFGPLGQIHNGADDNASGVAGLVEVIHAVTRHPLKLKRPILFAFWDAEEKGLLGSEHWVDEPTVPLSSVGLYVNVDMIGRMPDAGLTMYGVRTAAGLREFVSEQNRATDVAIAFDWTIKRDSDHYPLYRKGIPFLMLHTGLHDDYHRPSDDPEKLDWQGMEQASRLMFQLAVAAADAERLPTFRMQAARETPADEKELNEPAPAAPPRLGVSWDAELAQQGIVEIVDVQADSPADRAGLQRGDRLLKLNGVNLETAARFARLVARVESPVELTVRRQDIAEPMMINVPLNGNPVRLGISWRLDAAEPGVLIVIRVDPFSPAADAGLKAGDRILRAGDAPVESSERFAETVAHAKDSLNLLYERRGRLTTMTVSMDDEHESKGD